MEEKLLNNYSPPVTIECTEKILEQMKKGICKIKNRKGKGTGFFCKIKYENEIYPVMITANHIIDKEIIEENKLINITLNNDDEKGDKNIEINSNRKIYTSKKYDTTIIEIKPDIDQINYFLELDQNIFRPKNNIFDENIYIPQYPKLGIEQKAAVSYGILKDIKDFEINHFCSTEFGSSGSPIIYISNNNVIGVHTGSSKFNFNKGIFLKEPVSEYINTQIKLNREKEDNEPFSCIPPLINQLDISYNLFKKEIVQTIKTIEKGKGNDNFSFNNSEFEFFKLAQYIDQDKDHIHSLIDDFYEKCRYTSIKPYKHNAIEINTKDKYINASPVNFYYDKYMILTQGPKLNTIEDFWTMVDQYKCNIIIMLTNLMENSLEKCAYYWDSNYKMNKYTLSLISEESINFKTIDIRKIKLINNSSNEERIITQLHFLAWPDLEVPNKNLRTFQAFQYMIEEAEKIKNNCPIIIHCGGGVGRTATFTSIYFLFKEIIKQIKNNNLKNIRFSVFNIVRKMKETRLYSVETHKQYQFIYYFVDWLLFNYNI